MNQKLLTIQAYINSSSKQVTCNKPKHKLANGKITADYQPGNSKYALNILLFKNLKLPWFLDVILYCYVKFVSMLNYTLKLRALFFSAFC